MAVDGIGDQAPEIALLLAQHPIDVREQRHGIAQQALATQGDQRIAQLLGREPREVEHDQLGGERARARGDAARAARAFDHEHRAGAARERGGDRVDRGELIVVVEQLAGRGRDA